LELCKLCLQDEHQLHVTADLQEPNVVDQREELKERHLWVEDRQHVNETVQHDELHLRYIQENTELK
jgi:hypothetical protein